MPAFYLDTNAMNALNNDEIARLMEAVRRDALQIVFSQWVLWECGRQYYERHEGSLIYGPKAQQELHKKNDAQLVDWFYLRVHGSWVDAGATVINHDVEGIEEAGLGLLRSSETYFNSDNDNDQRDAFILATAQLCIDKDDVICICGDKKLKELFEYDGFNCCADPRPLLEPILQEIEGYPTGFDIEASPSVLESGFRDKAISFDDAYRTWHEAGEKIGTLPVKQAEAVLETMAKEEDEVRRILLSHTYWLAPADIDFLVDIMGTRQISEAIARANIDLLLRSGFARQVGNVLLPDSGGMCEAIAIERIQDVEDLLGGTTDG